ncbi:MAG: rhodanese-like domain-containing protein, partial [Candidatus Gracilibacteria bacterium]|nr:rhodanese-like domain-containing protein [Candidatus Gracilibacteria bacterium]
RMAVKYREEIVALGKKYSKDEIKSAGNRMSIEEFKYLLDNGNIDDYIVLDMRNNHEYKLGHFKNAIPANTMTFRELENEIENYKKQFGDKKVISYCTGGIRCEKSTVMLQKAGLKNTYQLDGGVVKYINTYNDGNWLGNLYVFDDRVSDFVGDENTHTTIGECVYSGKKTDNCENCRYSHCNARLITDKKEYKEHFGFCSLECAQNAIKTGHVKHIDFDKMQYKQKRAIIKNHPEKEEEIMNEIKTHLEENLLGVEFNHELSQKEDCIID